MKKGVIHFMINEPRYRGYRQNSNQENDNCCRESNEQARNVQENRNRCNGCACDQLRNLQTGTEVDVFLNGGVVLEDVVFINFNNNNCCAFFTDPTTEPGSTLIVDCQKIDAIRIEAD